VGKLGAFLGVFLFPVLSSALGLGGVLILCSGVGVAGALLTQVLPEKSGLSLDAASPPTTPVCVTESAMQLATESAERVPAETAA
jgi:hypothetical protein